VATRRTVVRATKAESVASLAKRYGLSISSVAQSNRISADGSFAKGQQITLLLPVKAGAPTKSKAKAGPRAAAKSGSKNRKRSSG
jgi:membrane-bound lytic murein transglycosylase D